MVSPKEGLKAQDDRAATRGRGQSRQCVPSTTPRRCRREMGDVAHCARGTPTERTGAPAQLQAAMHSERELRLAGGARHFLLPIRQSSRHLACRSSCPSAATTRNTNNKMKSATGEALERNNDKRRRLVERRWNQCKGGRLRNGWQHPLGGRNAGHWRRQQRGWKQGQRRNGGPRRGNGFHGWNESYRGHNERRKHRWSRDRRFSGSRLPRHRRTFNGDATSGILHRQHGGNAEPIRRMVGNDPGATDEQRCELWVEVDGKLRR